MLVSGKRVLVADDGTMTPAEGSEGLEHLELVPTATGPKLVGIASGSEVLRFDDPLRPGRRIAVLTGPHATVGTWPDRLFLRINSVPLWLDLEGKPVAGPSLPLAPTQVHFLDEKRGVAVFAAAGLAVTVDGGATWKQLDQGPTTDFDAHEGFLRIGARSVDAATGALSDADRSKEQPLAHFLRKLDVSPLEAATRGGVDMGNGKALVATGDELVEIDLATGLPGRPVSLRDSLPDSEWLDAGLWQGAAFVAKDGSRRAYFYAMGGVFSMFRPLVEVELGGKAPVFRKLLDLTNGMTPAIVSSSGAILVPGACPDYKGDDQPLTPSCVRQPSGVFETVWSDLESEWRGPQKDGGLVGVTSGDYPQKSQLVAVDRTGKKKTVLGPLCSDQFVTCAPETPFDEVGAGEFAALLSLLEGRGGQVVGALHVAGGKDTVRLTPGRLGARVYFRGKAASEAGDGLHVSVDAGRTWKRVPAPKLQDQGEDLAIGDLGLAWGKMLRIGWGEPTGKVPEAELPAPPATTVFLPATPKQGRVACELGKENKALVLFADERSARASLEPPKGKGYVPSSASLVAGLRTHARFEAQVPEADAKPARKPTVVFTWIDQTELGARSRSASAPAPAELGTKRMSLLFAQASGDKAFFVLRNGDQVLFGRASGSRLELVAVADKKAPRDAAIAADGAVAWVGDEGVGHWPVKGPPRTLVKVRPGQLAVGAPTKDGIPLLVGERSWASYRLLAIPKEGPAPWLDLAGWKTAPLSPGSLWTLDVCGAKAPPHRFVLSATTLAIAIPGAPPSKSTSLVVRTDGVTACLEGATARLGSDWFARVDLAKKKAEGGLVTRASYGMTCKVEKGE